MHCWICSTKSGFSRSLVQFIRGQEQWPGLGFRCFGNGVTKMANDLRIALTLPDVVVVDQRDGGWDVQSGIELCAALKRRGCSALIIYLDMTMKKGATTRYLVDVHEDEESADITFDSVEMVNASWDIRLMDSMGEALAESLAASQSGSGSRKGAPEFSLN